MLVLSLFALSGLLPAVPSFAQEAERDHPWAYTVDEPGASWQSAAYDETGWQRGRGGFGTIGTPGARVFTVWDTDDIWLRREVTLTELPSAPTLYIHHDEDAEVYFNGALVATFQDYTTGYEFFKLDADAARALRTGPNVLAVHCRQTGGGQFIDVHLVDGEHAPDLQTPPQPTVPFDSELVTRWGESVTPDNAWTEYPRPQLIRETTEGQTGTAWINLNGLWDYAVTENGDGVGTWAGKILVPFAIESRLSGVRRLLAPNELLWYRRTFRMPTSNAGERVLLHFEAVDYRTEVWVNDMLQGSHVGGSDPFSFDITDAMSAGDNTIVVKVADHTGGAQLRGKQVLNPSGIWYTRVSGIWQTVWLERVPATSIESVRFGTDVKTGRVITHVSLRRDGTSSADQNAHHIRVEFLDAAGREVAATSAEGLEAVVEIPDAQLWSPASPYLYDVRIALVDRGRHVVDRVSSYVGLRKVGRILDQNGDWRFTLNDKPVFHWGPLDQGWWPDGLMTPPSDEAIQFELEFLRAAGFNMIRKHIKVEPRRYYYHADRIGLMIWQDQVSGGDGPPWKRFSPDVEDAKWSDDDHAQFMMELEAMITTLDHFPSVVVWTAFNEAWGQHQTREVVEYIASRDDTRLINAASGGNFWPVGDIADWHEYPHPDFPFEEGRFADYIKVVGEFGGHGWPVDGHLWNPDRRNWGYGGLPESLDAYEARFRESIRLLLDLKSRGVAAGVYTQTTDVEGEINGLLTYDRAVSKLSAARLAEITRGLAD